MEQQDFEFLEQLKLKLIKAQKYEEADVIRETINELKKVANNKWTEKIIKDIENQLDVFGLPSTDIWDE